eukprot:Opistho-2@65659
MAAAMAGIQSLSFGDRLRTLRHRAKEKIGASGPVFSADFLSAEAELQKRTGAYATVLTQTRAFISSATQTAKATELLAHGMKEFAAAEGTPAPLSSSAQSVASIVESMSSVFHDLIECIANEWGTQCQKFLEVDAKTVDLLKSECEVARVYHQVCEEKAAKEYPHILRDSTSGGRSNPGGDSTSATAPQPTPEVIQKRDAALTCYTSAVERFVASVGFLRTVQTAHSLALYDIADAFGRFYTEGMSSIPPPPPSDILITATAAADYVASYPGGGLEGAYVRVHEGEGQESVSGDTRVSDPSLREKSVVESQSQPKATAAGDVHVDWEELSASVSQLVDCKGTDDHVRMTQEADGWIVRRVRSLPKSDVRYYLKQKVGSASTSAPSEARAVANQPALAKAAPVGVKGKAGAPSSAPPHNTAGDRANEAPVSSEALSVFGNDRPPSLGSMQSVGSGASEDHVPPSPVTSTSGAWIVLDDVSASHPPSCSIAGSVVAQRLVIRGTDFRSVRNLMLDLTVTKAGDPVFGPDVRVHAGFLLAANELIEDIVGCLDRRAPLSITGHSLGGAVGTLVALKLIHRGFNVESVITFGTPKFLSGPKEALARMHMPLRRLLRVYHHHDVVRRVSLPLSEFSHHGPVLMILPDSTHYVMQHAPVREPMDAAGPKGLTFSTHRTQFYFEAVDRAAKRALRAREKKTHRRRGSVTREVLAAIDATVGDDDGCMDGADCGGLQFASSPGDGGVQNRLSLGTDAVGLHSAPPREASNDASSEFDMEDD